MAKTASLRSSSSHRRRHFLNHVSSRKQALHHSRDLPFYRVADDVRPRCVDQQIDRFVLALTGTYQCSERSAYGDGVFTKEGTLAVSLVVDATTVSNRALYVDYC